ncbi:hypothetical protein D3C77_315020 [compost metagenome]
MQKCSEKLTKTRLRILHASGSDTHHVPLGPELLHINIQVQTESLDVRRNFGALLHRYGEQVRLLAMPGIGQRKAKKRNEKGFRALDDTQQRKAEL